MISGTHPIMRALDALPHPCHLVGSRLVGVHHDRSDWDLYIEASRDEWYGYGAHREAGSLRNELEALGFVLQPGGGGYGPDPALHAVMRWSDPEAPNTRWPDVDLFIAAPAVVARRMPVFRALVELGDRRAGQLMRGLKREAAWGTLWAALRLAGVSDG